MEDLVPTAKIADASDPNAVAEAADRLRRGGLVAFPTETVYGLGADAQNPLAVARVFEVKARPRMDPVIVHAADADMAQYYGTFPKSAPRLIDKFWPGPLTLIVRKRPSVPPIVTAGLETVAIRVPAHPAALNLIRAVGRAIAAPSANPFGYVSPTEAQHVVEQLGDKIDWILDGGPCAVGIESTIVSLITHPPSILRWGGITVEALRSVLGELDCATTAAKRPQAPGQFKRHYATLTHLEIASEATILPRPFERVGLLCLAPPDDGDRFAAVEILSPTGNMREATANLFRALRRLDRLSLDRIIARPMREEGLGAAIMERLRRCSYRG